MSENVANEHHFPVEVDRCNQPILVAANVKHVDITDLAVNVNGVESSLQIGKIVEIRSFDNLAPSLKRSLGFGMNRRKVEQRFI